MPTKIQSVILPKSKFSESAANAWILKKGFSNKGKRIYNYKTTNFFRFRQRPPSHFVKGSFRTKNFKNGVKVIFGTIPYKK